MKSFYLEIVATDKQFFSGNAETIVFPAVDGQHGVLAGHEPMVTTLSAGEMKFKVNGEWHYAAVGTGFVEIMPDYVILLADTVERPEEIDKARALAAKERAEERLRQKQSLVEYHKSQAALARALARLKVTSHHSSMH